MLAPVYVNDFFYQGRILRVVMQADAPFRMNAGCAQRLLPAEHPDERTHLNDAGSGGERRCCLKRRGEPVPMVPLVERRAPEAG